jgi:hypothetical protein
MCVCCVYLFLFGGFFVHYPMFIITKKRRTEWIGVFVVIVVVRNKTGRLADCTAPHLSYRNQASCDMT